MTTNTKNIALSNKKSSFMQETVEVNIKNVSHLPKVNKRSTASSSTRQ